MKFIKDSTKLQFLISQSLHFPASLQGKCTVCDGRDDMKEYSNIRSAMKVKPVTEDRIVLRLLDSEKCFLFV